MEVNNNSIQPKTADESILTEDFDDSALTSPCLDRSFQVVQTPSTRTVGGCKTPACLSSLGINQHDSVNSWDSTMETPTASSSTNVSKAESSESEKGKLLRKALFGRYESESAANSPVVANSPVTSTPVADQTTPLGSPALPSRLPLSSRRRLSQVFVYPKPVSVSVASSPLVNKARTPRSIPTEDAEVNGDSPVLSQRRRLSQPTPAEHLRQTPARSVERRCCGVSPPQKERKVSIETEGCGPNGKDEEEAGNAGTENVPGYLNSIEFHEDELVLQALVANSSSVGFATASGNQVLLTAEALSAAKRIFQEIIDDNRKSSTGSNAAVDTTGSEASLRQMQNVELINEDALESSKQTTETCFRSGFIKANGEHVPVSEKALQAAKNMFQEDTEITDPVAGTSFGFTTASGRRAQVSEKALEFARKMFQDEDETLAQVPQLSTGFGLVSEEKPQVSEKAPETAEKTSEDGKFAAPSLATGTSVGFSSASGKKMQVSEKALEAAKKMFQDEEEPRESNAVASFGFSSASGKKMQVSEKALEAAKKMFQDKGEPLESTAVASFGFSSASGKKVQVSEKALEAAKMMFQDQEEPLETTAKPSVGFSSASGKKVRVSDKALEAAKKMFLEETEPLEAPAGTRSENGVTDLKPEQPAEAANQEDAETPRRTVELGGFSRASGTRARLSHKPTKTVNDDSEEDMEVESAAEPFLKKRDLSSSRRATRIFGDRKRSFEDGVDPAGPSSDSKKIHRSLSDEDLFSRPGNAAAPVDEESFPSSPTLTKRKRSLPTQKPSTSETPPTDSQLFLLDNDPTFVAADVIRARNRARQLQESQICGKNRTLIKAETGVLSKMKTDPSAKRLTLKESFGRPGTLQNSMNLAPVAPSVQSVNAGNAERFFFQAWDHFDAETYRDNHDGIPLGDFDVILSNDNLIGLEQIQAAFLSHRAVDPTLVDSRWIANHYRWIVWKLASLERRYGLAKQFLTPSNVLEQLKYRYDREIDRCQRPALRRIMEQDDSPGKTLVLCVAGVEQQTNMALELTDGWYSIKAQCDVAMYSLIESGKVVAGLKLITSGAELVGSGGPCHPLEATAETYLKISTNSTRRAKWDTRLGYFSRPQPFPVSLSSIYCDGGLVSCVTVMVARVYPLIYREKAKEEVGTVYRSQRVFERKALREEQAFEVMKEKAFTDAVFKIEREEREAGLWDRSRADNLTDEEKRRQIEEEVLKQLSSSRPSSHSSVPVLKLRLVSAESVDSSPASGSSAMLAIWRPPEELCTLLKEQRVYRIYNLNPSEILRQGEMQLNSTSSTRYDEIANEKPPSCVRRVTPLALTNQTGFKPPFSELDVVGLVVYVSPLTSRNAFQDAVITDGSHYLAVRCWAGFEEYALDGLVKVGAFLAFANLGWRSSTCLARLPCAYVSELTTVTTRPGQQHLSSALEKLRGDLPDVEEALEGASADIACFLPSKTTPSPMTPLMNSAQRSAASPATPAAGLREPIVTRTPVTGTNEQVVNRTRLLERYGAPPPLSPLALTPSRNTRLAFKPPFKKPG